ncbi:nSTAND1 domain-containing NTPase [Actinoallomurus spadix]|uniref:nSTAND1 domain-containing NTPase n=1 Tax=Actinoallomurus spadix TaxID=79912 RepID=UPI0027E32C6B|nr:trypsin-like peptidase domain-containing protein [Actinoallomurus spadix]
MRILESPSSPDDAEAGSPDPIEDGRRRHCGFGLLVDSARVITCAHVVARSLGEPDDCEAPPPGTRVQLDFPLLAPGEVLTATIEAWAAMADDGRGDVAGLVLDDYPPAGARPHALARSGEVSGHDIMIYGYQDRAGHQPTWVPCAAVAPVEGGWLQLGLAEFTGGLRIRPGFSGSPVLDQQTGQVVGLTVRADTREGVWHAYAVTGEVVFEAWEQLRESRGRANPFKLLRPFEAADRNVFFGRDALAEQTLEKITGHDRALVTGASGTGKTSMLNALVVPGLNEIGRAVLVLTPSGDTTFWNDVVEAVDMTRLPLGAGPAEAPPADSPLDLKVSWLRAALGAERIVLVFDQFEELLSAEPTRVRDYTDELSEWPTVHDHGSPYVRVVVVVRDDLLPRLRQVWRAAPGPSATVTVGPLSREQLLQAVTGPVTATGFVRYEERLPERIVTDLGTQPYCLPALQVVLHDLWEHGVTDGLLRHSVYQELNGRDGPLAGHLRRTWHGLAESTRANARALFLNLVVPVGDDAFVRRVAYRSEIGEEQWETAVSLAFHRLVVVRGSARNDATVELVHDALLVQWQELAEHLAAHRDLIEWREDMRRRVSAWQRSGEQPGHLLRGKALAQELRRVNRLGPVLTAPEARFLSAARAHRRLRRRRRAIAAVTVVTLLIALTGVLLRLDGSAEEASRGDLSRRLAAQSQALTESDPALSALLAAAAWKTSETPEARYSMLRVRYSPNRATLMGTGGSSLGGAFSPDGRLLATGGGHNDEAIHLWDTRTHRHLAQFSQGEGTIWNTAFSPDGKMVAGASKFGHVALVDLTGRRVRKLDLTSHFDIRDVAFSPDGRIVAGVAGDVHLWDTTTGRETIPAIRPAEGAESITFDARRGQLITGGRDGVVRFWTLSGRPVGSLKAAAGPPDKAVLSYVEISADGKVLVTSDASRRIRVWDVTGRRRIGGTLTGSSAAVSPDGRIIAYADHKSVRLWNVEQRRPVGAALTGHFVDINGMAFSPDGGTLATTSGDTTVRLWDIGAYRSIDAPLAVASGKNLNTGGGPADPREVPGGVDEVAFSPDGRTLATGGADLRLWDVATKREIGTPLAIYNHGSGNTGVAGRISFSPDGRYLVAIGGQVTSNVTIWDLSTRPPIPYPLTDHGKPIDVGQVGFASGVWRMYSIPDHGRIEVWDLSSRRVITTIPGDFTALNDLAVSPDGKMIATSHYILRTIQLFDMGKRKLVATLNSGHANAVRTVAFSPQGSLFASAGDDPDPRLWNTTTRAPVGAPLRGHSGPVFTLAFSPDGKTLAAADADHSVRLWDVDSRQPIGQPLTGHTSDIRSMSFSRDGRLMATGSSDGTVRFWRMTPTTDLPTTMCRIAGRPLEAAEWHRYAPGEEMPHVCD